MRVKKVPLFSFCGPVNRAWFVYRVSEARHATNLCRGYQGAMRHAGYTIHGMGDEGQVVGG